MKRKTIYNLDTLVSVKIEDKKECTYLKFVPTRNYWLFTIKEHFTDDNHRYSKEYLEAKGYYSGDSMLVENNKVYFKPSATLRFANQESYTKKFDTIQEATKWGLEQAGRGMYVKLEIEDN